MGTTAQRKVALELMERLDFLRPYTEVFKKDGIVCLFEDFFGSPVTAKGEPEIFQKIKEIESREGVLVYAVTHDVLYEYNMYSFLVITKYPEEWPLMLSQYGDQFRAFAYVWNKDEEWRSEFGSVMLYALCNGIKRAE